MELILKSTYKKLGKKGDIVTVKDGYGRNCLIPKGVAVVASKGNKKSALENIKQIDRKALKFKADAQALLAILDSTKVVVKAKVGEHGKIFGSITPLQIAQALKEKGIGMIDYTNIHLEVPIKTIGSHQAKIILNEEITYMLDFLVISH